MRDQLHAPAAIAPRYSNNKICYTRQATTMLVMGFESETPAFGRLR